MHHPRRDNGHPGNRTAKGLTYPEGFLLRAICWLGQFLRCKQTCSAIEGAYSIRRARKRRDLFHLIRFSRALMTETERIDPKYDTVRKGYQIVFRRHRRWVFVACDASGTPVAMALAAGSEDSECEGGIRILLTSLYVTPAVRGKGLGWALCETILTQAAATRDVVAVRLFVARDNAEAIAFYSSHGFRREHDYLVLDYRLRSPAGSVQPERLTRPHLPGQADPTSPAER